MGISKRTLQKRFDALYVYTGERVSAGSDEPIVAVMDATMIGTVGILTLIRDTQKNNMYWYWSETEKVEHYEKCLEALVLLGYSFSAFVIDGFPGLRQMLERKFPEAKIQLCQKHQIDAIKRLIPQKAKSEAARALRRIALKIPEYSSFQFSVALEIWFVLYKDFLNEKTKSMDPTSKKKWWYTHKNLRSAYNSLKKNSPYLFTCREYPDLNIPNTTNYCEGYFSHFKERLNRHRGLSPKRKSNMANFLLENF